MPYSRRHVLASAGLGFAVLAGIAPWALAAEAHTVFSLPHWSLWALSALTLHLVSFVGGERDAGWVQAATGVLGVTTLTAVVLIVRGYGETFVRYGWLPPQRGVGVAFAVCAVLCAAAAGLLRERAASAPAR